MTSTFVEVYCPRCGYAFQAEATDVGKTAGGTGGVLAGAALGAKIGIVAGPIGAIAGTIPGAILGGLFGVKAGNKFDRPLCPKCGWSFDMVKPTFLSGRIQNTDPNIDVKRADRKALYAELDKYVNPKTDTKTTVAVNVASGILGMQFAMGNTDLITIYEQKDFFAIGYVFGAFGGASRANGFSLESPEFMDVSVQGFVGFVGSSKASEIFEWMSTLHEHDEYNRGCHFGDKQLSDFIKDQTPPLGLAAYLLEKKN